MTTSETSQDAKKQQQNTWLLLGGLIAVVVYSYWNTLVRTSMAWESPMYSHGYLIPFFTAVLIYMRAEPFTATGKLERWWGVGLIAFSTVMRVAAAYFVQFSIDRLSLVICLIGVFVLVGGFRALRWAGPALLFLVFMFPLPRPLVDNILRPMQTMATMSSVYALQTFGLDVYRDGNRIMLEHSAMNVVDQCSGLRMLTIFIALAIAIAMISPHRPLWERITVVFSSVPIALLVNVIRITLTGMLYNLNLDEAIVNHIFHDFAGIIMMPMAVGFLLLEMQILQRLIIEDERPTRPVSLGTVN